MQIDFGSDKEFIAVIDFEATCSNDGSVPKDEMEIIEFACIIIDRRLEEFDRFDAFIKPRLHPKLTSFCTELTSIEQADIDNADTFPLVLERFVTAIVSKYHPLFASWGRYDKSQLEEVA